MHQTFASIEDLDTALGYVPLQATSTCTDEVLGSARTMIAYYRAGWGYRSEEAVRMFGIHARGPANVNRLGPS